MRHIIIIRQFTFSALNRLRSFGITLHFRMAFAHLNGNLIHLGACFRGVIWQIVSIQRRLNSVVWFYYVGFISAKKTKRPVKHEFRSEWIKISRDSQRTPFCFFCDTDKLKLLKIGRTTNSLFLQGWAEEWTRRAPCDALTLLFCWRTTTSMDDQHQQQ